AGGEAHAQGEAAAATDAGEGGGLGVGGGLTAGAIRGGANRLNGDLANGQDTGYGTAGWKLISGKILADTMPQTGAAAAARSSRGSA
ncbi:MAG: hypothetical protein ABIP94_09100, partial [Planctomycetota bacterium]